VICEEAKYYALKYDDRPLIQIKSGNNFYYFRQVREEEVRVEGEKRWYGYYYVPVFDIVPLKVEVKIPQDLVPYVPKDDEIPRGDVIEASIQPKLFDIIPGYNLYLGSQDAAVNVDGLNEKGVKHILNVATGITNKYPDIYTYCNIPILDLEVSNIRDIFEQCFQFMDNARTEGGVLVHCNAGVSRSATIVIAYLMKRNGMNFSDAYNLVKSVKTDIKPNPGFHQQLIQFDFELYGKK
jgi:atypical dual specificity phosphatase